MKYLLISVFAASILIGGDGRLADAPQAPGFETPRTERLWRWSMFALAGAAAADVASSYGRQEANPLLRSHDGRFAYRGIALKGAVIGSIVVMNLILVRRASDRRRAARVNFAAAGATGAVAARNFIVR